MLTRIEITFIYILQHNLRYKNTKKLTNFQIKKCSDNQYFFIKKDFESYEQLSKTRVEKFQEMKYNESSKWKDLKGFYTFKKSNHEATYNDYLLHVISDYAPGIPLLPDRVNGYVLKDVKAKKDKDHILKRMVERNITSDELQEYVDNAKIMFNQWNGKRRLYISDKGASVVVLRDDNWIFKTGMKYTDYGENYMTILEELKRWKK